MRATRTLATGLAATGVAVVIAVGVALSGHVAQPASTQTAAQAFSLDTPSAQPSRRPTSLVALEEMVSSGQLSAVELDPKTGRVISASGRDLPASPTSQEALTRVAFTTNATSVITAYISTHSTAATVDPASGRLASVTFSRK